MGIFETVRETKLVKLGNSCAFRGLKIDLLGCILCLIPQPTKTQTQVSVFLTLKQLNSVKFLFPFIGPI